MHVLERQFLQKVRFCHIHGVDSEQPRRAHENPEQSTHVRQRLAQVVFRDDLLHERRAHVQNRIEPQRNPIVFVEPLLQLLENQPSLLVVDASGFIIHYFFSSSVLLSRYCTLAPPSIFASAQSCMS